MRKLLLIVCAAYALMSPIRACAQVKAFEYAPVADFTKEDHELARQTLNDALNSIDPAGPHNSKTWTNPKSGNSGSVTVSPAPDYEGMTCRTVVVESRAGSNVGRQTHRWCRIPDGSWKIAPISATGASGTSR